MFLRVKEPLSARFIVALLLVGLVIFVEGKNVRKVKDVAPVIQTPYGSIRGVSDDYAYSYLGIPFAQPPVNELRWKDPVDAKPWSPLILNATFLKPACPQLNCSSRMPVETCPKNISEDCLYLNVYVPKTNLKTPKAVMVFIHGGNFQYQGASSLLFDGRFFTNHSDVVIVNIEYRLGALGFLVTGLQADQIQGNFGLKDQRLAIKWVKNNIQAFYGDPNRITIFGQSAGAQSINVHLLSPDMQSYFNNAVLMSSPASIPFRNYNEAIAIYAYFAQFLNCTIEDTKCLMKKTVDEILVAQMAVEAKITSFKLLEFFEPWLPWIDKKLVHGQVLDFNQWNLGENFLFKPFILGTLTEECVIYIYSGFGNKMSVSTYGELVLAAFKQDSLKVFQNYLPNTTSDDQRNVASVLGTHWVFSCSNRNFLEQAIEWNAKRLANTKFYQYVFDYPLDFNGWDNFTYCNGRTCHGTDMVYTFDVESQNYTDTGRYIAVTHMDYFSSFAKYNDPMSSNNLTWPFYDLNSKKYLRFKGPANEIDSNYIKSNCDMFDSIGYIH